ncbi:glycosyltransferase family 4 protein [Winogradskyella echinorum]|uniref:Glycosyltransferase family 4 protein n=1 Tax=Winogradskyella echinorum TaxID=538189 RepID=A0ABR6XXF2_9FLAO|nr:glycosyltransferase family 4 protein [Winogradskyella echinorum]MBC3845172.1 glycosyltransferase family 4 protein [Winogradskyella echinorum]MBC5749520.1 glycosyltransferase family 4 protein [Winogradskyella echinorum]
MINVGVITGNHYPRLGGMEIAVHNLVKKMQPINGVSTAVACSTMPEISKSFQYPYPCYRAKSFSFLTPYLFKINQIKMIRENNINILHGPMLHGGGFDAVKLSSKLNIPAVVHSRGSDVQMVKEINYGAQLDAKSLEKIKFAIQHSNHIIAVSDINKKNLIELGAQNDKISVIPNGILINEINNIPFQEVRNKYGLSLDDFVLIAVGRNRPIKRMELLFKALSLLKSYKKIKCLCVGPKENLGVLAKKYNVQDNVIITGKIPLKNDISQEQPYAELINAYRSANLYISTSYVESFGNAAADALACGIPVVIGQKHGVKDIIIEGKTGWTMPQENENSLAELIISLYQKRESILNDKEKIKESVSHLTWHNIALQTVEVYKSML